MMSKEQVSQVLQKDFNRAIPGRRRHRRDRGRQRASVMTTEVATKR